MLLGALVIGLALGGLSSVHLPAAAAAVAGGLATLVVGSSRPRRCVAMLAITLAAAGLAWGQARATSTAPAPLAHTGAAEGTVRTDGPPRLAASGRLRVTARTVALGAEGGPLASGLRLIVDLPTDEAVPKLGALLNVEGQLRPAAGNDAPGWWGRYLEREAISGRLAASALQEVDGESPGGRDGWRRWTQQRISARIAGERGAVVRGLALGGGTGLSPETAGEFRDAGIWHLLAVSGQNVTAVALAVLAAGRALWVPRSAALALAGAAVVAYALACDGGASVGRAVAVGLIVLLAQFVGRGRDPWYVLLLALACLLGFQPRAVHDPGLHLSFAAVVGLLVLAPRIDGLARGWLPRPVAVLLAASVGAALATAPVLALHFGRLSLVGIGVNIVAVPLAAPVVVLALLGLVADAVVGGAGRPFTAGAAAGAEALMVVSHHAARVPHAAVDVPEWSALPLALLAGGVLFALRRGYGRLVSQGAVVGVGAWFAVAALATASPPWPTTPEIAVLDVGQGQAVLLRDPSGTTTLVDAGPPGSPAAIEGALSRHGVARVDLLILTHGARDQAGGVPALLRSAEVGHVVHGPFGREEGEADGLDVVRVLKDRGSVVREVHAGDRMTAGDWSVDVVWPPRGIGGLPANDRSLVLVARAGGMVVVIASDAEGHVLRRAPLPDVDVLVVAHHGSDDPALPEALTRMRPEHALISVGKDNRHGHPAPTTLAELLVAGSRVSRTDLDGDLIVSAGE